MTKLTPVQQEALEMIARQEPNTIAEVLRTAILSYDGIYSLAQAGKRTGAIQQPHISLEDKGNLGYHVALWDGNPTPQGGKINYELQRHASLIVEDDIPRMFCGCAEDDLKNISKREVYSHRDPAYTLAAIFDLKIYEI